MRELKFRAWDKRKRIMVYRNENESADYWDGVYGSEIELINSLLNDSSYEFMQYTGLKDRNGREIYEGDIVKWGQLEGNTENPVRIAIVEFDPDLQFRCINLDHIFRFGCFMYPSEALEVIGNIYENPEWLEEKENE